MAALKQPVINKRLIELAYVPQGESPEAFATHIKSEIESLGRVLRGVVYP